MIVLFAITGLAPLVLGVSVVLWRRFIVGDRTAGSLITAVAYGLIAGVLMGAAVVALLVVAVLAIKRAIS